ncbi:hypothetical protein D3C81_1033790 [compost metagenome]
MPGVTTGAAPFRPTVSVPLPVRLAVPSPLRLPYWTAIVCGVPAAGTRASRPGALRVAAVLKGCG